MHISQGGESSPATSKVSLLPNDLGRCPRWDGLNGLTRDQFCARYDLGEEVKRLLVQYKIEAADALLIDDVRERLGADLKTGHLSEVNWALRKMLMDQVKRSSRVAQKHKPTVSGGTGGAGGNSSTRPGTGGTGYGPVISIEDLHRFSVISGGTGGAGGNDLDPRKESYQDTELRRRANCDLLSGGTGGNGGYGEQVGGKGGFGTAADIAIEDSRYFSSITGGIRGAGGHSDLQGGWGGAGEEPNFNRRLLHAIDDDGRRQLPEATLEDLGLKEDLLQLLKDEGFRTVGALFELYNTDLPISRFKRGHPIALMAAVNRFVYQSKLN
ncbi:hypothetical protein R3P38DRAFT_3242970 [Favolaschia claudopus]|uniref:Uncharacterized protein n=1 Tax=Favolaschia claudopus TaxID=2862362 RepID=A0AAV9Z3P8_9AGAR